MLKKHDIIAFILLNIITCGIYSFFFIYQITRDLNAMDEENNYDPALQVLLNIVTCGVYMFIWYYIEGNRIKTIGEKHNITINEDGTSYILWHVLGMLTCGLVSLYGIYLYITNFNKIVDSYNEKKAN